MTIEDCIRISNIGCVTNRRISMTIEDCIRISGYIKDFDVRALAHRVGDAYDKHMKGETLEKIDVFVLGLRYYEFYATGSTDEDYYRAERKQKLMLDKLNLNQAKWYQIVEKETGLK